MKVVQINFVYGYSSTGRTTKELHLELQKRGIDSYVFCTNNSAPDQNIFLIGSPLDWKIHAFLSRLIGLQGYFSYFATRKLIRRLDSIRPDILHLRNLHANYINLPMLLSYLGSRAIPTVITLHDCWLYTGKCCYYIDSRCEKWKSECGKCPEKKRWNKSWFFDFSHFMLEDKRRLFGQIENLAVVGVSDWITGEAKQSFFKDHARFERIYNWIDLERFAPELSDNQNENFTALAVAQTWNRAKGIFDIQYIARKLPDITFQLVGKLPDNIEMPENVVALGEISDVKKLAELYRKADVFLGLSIQETFGKAVAEALSSGTPAIVYNNTAAPELVSDGCGYAVTTGDCEAVMEKLRVIQKNGKQMYTHACRQKALAEFDMHKNIQKYIDLYEEMSKERVFKTE